MNLLKRDLKQLFDVFVKEKKYIKFLHNMSSSSALPLGVKCEIAAVAEELPPRDSPFAALRRDRRLRFS
jgi:hypothetical protein